MPQEEEEGEDKETLIAWVLETLGGVKEEIFESLVKTAEGNTSWVDGIVRTLVNEQEEYNEMYRGGGSGEDNEGKRKEAEENIKKEEDLEEEEDCEEEESCAVVTWRCLSQVLGLDTSPSPSPSPSASPSP